MTGTGADGERERHEAGADGHVDFFISYAGPDRPWAHWVGAQLEAAEYSVELDVWDWSVGDNFVLRMTDALARAERVVSLWSPAYFERERFTTQEWTAVLADQTRRTDGTGPADWPRLIPLRVAPGERPAILRPYVYRDLFGLNEGQARTELLAAVERPSGRRDEYAFPGDTGGAASRPDRVRRPRVPGSLPVVWNVRTRNPAFTGRGSMLAALHDGLVAGGRSVVQALNGMGGVGKTQLAVEYAHLFCGEYNLVWWIEAEQTELIGDQIADLARAAGWASADAPVSTSHSAVMDRLRQTGRWLLVFDNVTQPDDVYPWLPQGPGHVVITSRHRGFAGIAVPVEVEVFSRAESIELVQGHSAQISHDNAGRVAEALGDLPLALAQAVGLLAGGGRLSVDDYLAELRDNASAILDEGRPLDYPLPLAAAIRASLTRLDEHDRGAVRLLDLAAVLSPEPIPRAWFRDPRPTEATTTAADTTRSTTRDVLGEELAEIAGRAAAFARALGRIADLGLADISEHAIQLHRLTQAVIRDRHTPDQLTALHRDAAHLVASAEPDDDGSDPASWPDWAQLLPHLLALDPTNPPDNSPDFKHTACNALWYLVERGDYRTALSLADAWRAAWESITDQDDHHVLWAASVLAAANNELGKYQEALALEQDIYERRRRVMGDDDPFTLASAHNLALGLRAVGRDDEALALDEDTYERRRRLLGDDHRFTLSSAQSLADALRHVGHDEALARGQDIYERRRRVLGDDHPETLVSAHNLAVGLSTVGRDDEALALHQDTYERLRRVLGDDHPDTFGLAAHNLAIRLHTAGRDDEALALGHDTYARRRRVLGDDHPDTFVSAHNLAVYLHTVGRDDEALAQDQDTYARRRRVLGDDHPDTLSTADNLANDLRAVGRDDEALALGQDTYARRRRVLGDDHPDTLSTADNLANDLRAVGRDDEALAQDTYARRRVLGDDHPDTP